MIQNLPTHSLAQEEKSNDFTPEKKDKLVKNTDKKAMGSIRKGSTKSIKSFHY